MSPHPVMNQSASSKAPRPSQGTFLHPPMDSWSPARLLDYFRTRQSVSYFPVVDEAETSPEKMDHILENRFEFHHEAYQLPTPLPWLHNPSSDREWLFMLHKFYYGVGLGRLFRETKDHRYAEKWQELTASWIATVPLNFLPSRVTGRRIQNWIYAHYYFFTLPDGPNLEPDFYGRFLESLHRQVVHLLSHLDQARNHRTLELSAIFLAAVVFPEFQGSEEWLAFAKRELETNLQEDLLPDGVHCELSTEYHHLVLKNYLGVMRLAHANEVPMPASMHRRIQQALDFTLHVHKPDGLIPAISDGDVGGYLQLLQQGYDLYGNESWHYAATRGTAGQPPSERSKGFSDAGYYILRSGWGEGPEPYEDERYLFFDCGPLGAGNHGHLDALNIEVAAYGQSLIVDPGRYTYDESGDINWRARFRGTAYHNTVLVDGTNQTAYLPGETKYEIRGPHAQCHLQSWMTGPHIDYLHGIVHSAEYPVTHERIIFFLRPDYWIISDLLRAREPHQYDLLFHLAPLADNHVSSSVANSTLRIETPHLLLAQPFDSANHFSVEQGYISPTYGFKQAAPVIRFSRTAATACYHTILYPYKTCPPDLSIQQVPISCQGMPCQPTQASAFCLTGQDPQGRRFQDYYFLRIQEEEGAYHFGSWMCAQKALVIRTNGQGQTVAEQGVANP